MKAAAILACALPLLLTACGGRTAGPVETATDTVEVVIPETPHAAAAADSLRAGVDGAAPHDSVSPDSLRADLGRVAGQARPRKGARLPDSIKNSGPLGSRFNTKTLPAQ